jgi:hypothetical protein
MFRRARYVCPVVAWLSGPGWLQRTGRFNRHKLSLLKGYNMLFDKEGMLERQLRKEET